MTVLHAGVAAGRIAVIVTRTEQREYLRAEHERLRAEHLRLRGEFQALRNTGFTQHDVKAQVQRLRAHFDSLENHLVGLEWMRHPPWERM